MERHGSAQRIQIIHLYYENQRSTRNVFDALRKTYERTICYTIEKFETQFSLLDNIRPNRSHPAGSKQNIAIVDEDVSNERA